MRARVPTQENGRHHRFRFGTNYPESANQILSAAPLLSIGLIVPKMVWRGARKCLRSQCRSSLVRASRYTVTAADTIVVKRRARRRSRQEKEEVSNEGSIDGKARRDGAGRKRGNRRGKRVGFLGSGVPRLRGVRERVVLGTS